MVFSKCFHFLFCFHPTIKMVGFPAVNHKKQKKCGTLYTTINKQFFHLLVNILAYLLLNSLAPYTFKV